MTGPRILNDQAVEVSSLLDATVELVEPDWLTDATHWHSHIPFAFFIVRLLAPRRLVELGTWQGDSYCAFCQAVEASGLNTTAAAVDTWQGDLHTGTYATAVLDELRAYHDPRYGAFSELVRSGFDEALCWFEDSSIDLLHIDGCHVYDAVRHDFDAWLPKLSDRGVVLFHDTCHRGDGFGVWRLWEEIIDSGPSFCFTHGHGLGVLAPGSSPDPTVVAFLERANRDGGATRRHFEALGAGVAAVARERLKIEAQPMAARSETTRLQNELATLRSSRSFRYTALLRAVYARVRQEAARLSSRA